MGTLSADKSAQSATNRPECTESLTNPIRITHIVSSLQVGGMEQFVVRMADAQRRRGHRVTILSIRDGVLARPARDLGIKVHVLGGRHKVQRVLSALFQFALLRPDIVHAHNATSLHYAELAKRASDARIVYTSHGEGRAPGRIAKSHEITNVDAAVAVSEAVAEQLSVPELIGKIRVIKNGVSACEPFKSREDVRTELGLGDEFVALIVARIDGLKGHNTLIQAAGLLKQRMSAQVTILIAGDGKDRVAMETLSSNLGLDQGNVRFLGFRADVVDLLGAVDAFVLPSLTEGLPLSMLEAMAQKTPVIATPVGGIPELIAQDETGLLVAVDDAEALAGAIAKLAADPALRNRLASEAFRLIEMQYSFAEMTHNYERLYRTLLVPSTG